MCPNYRECNNNGCVKRHPKTCKYFARNSRCKFERCAYSHEKGGIELKIEIVEDEISSLKDDIKELKETNKEMLDNVRVEARANSRQLATLISTVDDIVRRLCIIEQEETKQTERAVNVQELKHGNDVKRDKQHKEREEESDSEKHMNIYTMEKVPIKLTSYKEMKDLSNTEIEMQNMKCPKCEYECKKKVILSKHMNTEHRSIHSNAQVRNSKCSLCEDTFESKSEFEEHIKDHMDEIEGLDITTLTNNHDMFECNLCSFESGVGDSIKEHLIDHVNQSNYEEKQNKEENIQSIAKALLDEYDDDGNYNGDDSAVIDSESENHSDYDN